MNRKKQLLMILGVVILPLLVVFWWWGMFNDSQLYEKTGLFDAIIPDLVLQGLRRAYEYSHLEFK